MGISWAYRRLKNSLSLTEAKDLAIYGQMLDFGAPRGWARLALMWVVPHLERTLSTAYGQTVRLP
jgi:hypothetical protein